MRLGDLDALCQRVKRSTASKAVKVLAEVLINTAPTISAVPVVRCKNCKHFNLQTHECENESLSTDHEGGASYSLNFYDDDFCSYGEWREAAHEVSEP